MPLRRLPLRAAFLLLASACHTSAPSGAPGSLAVAAASPDLTLPQSKWVEGGTSRVGVVVVVDHDVVRVAGDRFPIARIPSDARLGLSADDKLDGFRDDYIITPLDHAVSGAPRLPPDLEASVDVEVKVSTSPSVVVVAADARTPYRVLAEVVATSGQAHEDAVGLAVRGPDGVAVVPLSDLVAPAGTENLVLRNPAFSPRSGPRRRPRPQGAVPVIAIRQEGFGVSVGGQNVAPGCKSTGAGLAVPNGPDGMRAFGALRDCIARIHEQAPEMDMDVVWLAAEPHIDVATLVATRDAIARDASGGELVEDIGLVKPLDATVAE
ncbi:MAG: hypothetical protein ACLQVI_27255 [Polyangiaceae bacterium]